jgi:hypothetical protein
MGELLELPIRSRRGPSQPRSVPQRVLTAVLALVLLLGLVVALGAAMTWLVNRAGLGAKLELEHGICLFLAAQVLLLPCYLSLGRNTNGTSGLS